MNQQHSKTGFDWGLLLLPLRILFWPFAAAGRWAWEHWFSYVVGRVLRDQDRVYSVRFVWYGDSIYLHPMVWGSLLLYVVVKSGVFLPGWPLLVWFLLLAFCFLTVIYNFDVLKGSVLVVCVIAVLSLAYVANSEWEWNFLGAVAGHVKSLNAAVEPGFYIVAAYIFAMLIGVEVIWAWLFNRVEIDEAYVYERKFLQSSTRDPIFARGLKRETKDLLELIIMGAADISHRTRSGSKTFTNIPAASLGLGRAIDDMLDYRRSGEPDAERHRRQEGSEAAMDDGPSEGFE